MVDVVGSGELASLGLLLDATAIPEIAIPHLLDRQPQLREITHRVVHRRALFIPHRCVIR